MEYNIIVAPNLEILATQVSTFFLQGWKLKGAILEHKEGFAQQLVRSPTEAVRTRAKKDVRKSRTKWIE